MRGGIFGFRQPFGFQIDLRPSETYRATESPLLPCGGGLGWGLVRLQKFLRAAAAKAVLRTATPSPTLPRAWSAGEGVGDTGNFRFQTALVRRRPFPPARE